MKLIKKIAKPTLLGALLGLIVPCSSQAFPGFITQRKVVSGLLGALVGGGIGLALYLDELHTWKANKEKKKNNKPCWYNFVGWGAVAGSIVGYNIHECTERSSIPLMNQNQTFTLSDENKKALWGSVENAPLNSTAHAILGVSKNASKTEIKQRHAILSRKFHPDKNPEADNNLMAIINAARDQLSK